MIEYIVHLESGNGFSVSAKAYGLRVLEAIETMLIADRNIRGGVVKNG